jgi:hypothetical protein
VAEYPGLGVIATLWLWYLEHSFPVGMVSAFLKLLSAFRRLNSKLSPAPGRTGLMF